MIDSTSIANFHFPRGIGAAIFGGTTLLLLVSCKAEPTPKELAEIYCNCVQARKHIEGQMKYIPCRKQVASQSEKYKRWLWRTADSIDRQAPELEQEDDKYVTKMLSEVDKICPGE